MTESNRTSDFGDRAPRASSALEASDSSEAAPFPPLFAVDVGNTRAKFVVWFAPDVSDASAPFDFEFDDASETFEATTAWLELLPLKRERPARWIVSSVSPRKNRALSEAVRRVRPNDSFVSLRLADVPIDARYDRPEKLGIDRAVAAFAGTRVFGPNRPFLTIDVGTAATIDYVDADGVFRGGAILPGPRLVAESLRAKTAQLPLVDAGEDDSLAYPATETQNAIRLGVVYSSIGAVGAFYWKIRRRILESGGDPSRLALLVAGGYAAGTERNLRTLFDDLAANFGFARVADVSGVAPPEIVVEPRLVERGLWEIARTQPSEFWTPRRD